MKQNINTNLQYLLIKQKLQKMNIPNFSSQKGEINYIAKARITIDLNTYIYIFEFEDETILGLICWNGDLKKGDLEYFELKSLKRKIPFFIELEEVEIPLDEIEKELRLIIHNNQQMMDNLF
uniref:Uncharacterized protein n=2 Tax=Aliarcobacter butzleri TaxID=28197 RepID=W0M0I9_9BACT|nr:hypothetical protein [Aliarcobacter butzleri]